METKFSFDYAGKRHDFLAENGAVYELESGISVKVESKLYKEYDALEWVLWFENNSTKNSEIFSNILDSDSLLPLKYPELKRNGYMPKKGDACVITMTGMVPGYYYWVNDKVSATEYNLNYEYLDTMWGTTKRFANTGGRSSEGLMPFFDVTASGDGYITAIGWTGDWKCEFTKTELGVQMKTGLKETKFYLKPGEKIRTSSVLVMKYDSSEDKYNKFRKLIKNYYSHKTNTKVERDGVMAYILWGGVNSEEIKKRISEFEKHNIKFEEVWIDAGWYGNCEKCDDTFSGDWGEHTGEWTVNTRVHPQKFVDVKNSAKQIGANLMLWFEPERAIKGTEITTNHPDWFLTIEERKNFVLNYGNEDALNYVIELLSDYTKNLDLSCYRQDFNMQLTETFKANDEENRRGITEIKHITGMYQLWDTLLERFPTLIIDNCASGGRRIDIETLKRSIPVFRSDYQCNFNANPEVLQVHNSNISLYLPYNGCTTKTKNDTYAIRSTYQSSFGGAFYSTIFHTMDEDDFKWAKKITDEYRSIRKYFAMDFYNHGSLCFDATAWTIWQYHDEETQSGIVLAFRRSESPFEEVKVSLKGLLSNKNYTFTNIDDGKEQDGGSALTIKLAEKRSSVILKYQLKG